jgi:hypothetical protein
MEAPGQSPRTARRGQERGAGLGCQELPPRRTGAARRRINARSRPDLPRWTAQPRCRASSVRPGSGDVPTPDSPSPGESPGGRRLGPSAGARAYAACSCRTCGRPACDARPRASRASRGRSRTSACAAGAVPARRTLIRSPGSYRARPAPNKPATTATINVGNGAGDTPNRGIGRHRFCRESPTGPAKIPRTVELRDRMVSGVLLARCVS